MSSQYDANGNLIDGITTVGRKQQTIQTHNQVSIPLTSSASSSYFDCSGYDNIGITMKSDASHSNRVAIQWSQDGTTICGETLTTEFIPTATQQYREGQTGIKARYARVNVFNLDAGSAHVMSAWAYLKV